MSKRRYGLPAAGGAPSHRGKVVVVGQALHLPAAGRLAGYLAFVKRTAMTQ